MKTISKMFQPFDIAVQPFIMDIDAKEVVIRQYADTATMDRIKGIKIFHGVGYNIGDSNASVL